MQIIQSVSDYDYEIILTFMKQYKFKVAIPVLDFFFKQYELWAIYFLLDIAFASKKIFQCML